MLDCVRFTDRTDIIPQITGDLFTDGNFYIAVMLLNNLKLIVLGEHLGCTVFVLHGHPYLICIFDGIIHIRLDRYHVVAQQIVWTASLNQIGRGLLRSGIRLRCRVCGGTLAPIQLSVKGAQIEGLVVLRCCICIGFFSLSCGQHCSSRLQCHTGNAVCGTVLRVYRLYGIINRCGEGIAVHCNGTRRTCVRIAHCNRTAAQCDRAVPGHVDPGAVDGGEDRVAVRLLNRRILEQQFIACRGQSLISQQFNRLTGFSFTQCCSRG